MEAGAKAQAAVAILPLSSQASSMPFQFDSLATLTLQPRLCQCLPTARDLSAEAQAC